MRHARTGGANSSGITKQDLTQRDSWKMIPNGNLRPLFIRRWQRLEATGAKKRRRGSIACAWSISFGGIDSAEFRDLIVRYFRQCLKTSFFCPKGIQRAHSFSVATQCQKGHTSSMTTRVLHLCGWSIRCACVALSLALCASVLADSSKNVVIPAKQQLAAQKRVKKVCYVMISGWGIPQPCDRLGGIPTTVYPMDRLAR